MYLLLDTDTLNHDVNRQKCLQNGGNLPEPRSDEQNQFLNNLKTYSFVLGIIDSEHGWLWESDRTPVVYNNWDFGNPKGGYNCAFMVKTWIDGGARWSDFPCVTNVYTDEYDKIFFFF